MPRRHTRPADPDPVVESGSSPRVSAPLTGAYRPIRRVAPPETPLPGVLAAAGERRVLLVDAVTAEDRVFAGRGETPQHLLTPLDLVRRADGHDLELPWCREPVARLLDIRAAHGRPLAGGELVTLVVSLLRGTREAWQDVPPEDEPPAGRWWLDDDGRPLFAPTPDGGAVVAEADALLERVATQTRDRVLLRLIGEAREALQRPRRLRRVLEPLEDALFEACAPRTIERIEPRLLPRGLDEIDREPVVVVRPTGNGVLADIVERFTDAAFADAVGEAVDRVRGALRHRAGGGRRLPLIVGGVVAVAIVAGGLLWPTDPEAADAHAGRSRQVEKSRAATSGRPSPSTSAAATGEPDPSPTASSGEDPQHAAERLRAAIAECAAHGDPLCGPVREDGSEPLSEDVLAVLAAAEGVSLLDDYGDVAVLRADAPDGVGSALMQLVRLDGRWLLRGAQGLEAQ